MEAALSFERSKQTYSTRYKNPKDNSLNKTHLQNLKTTTVPHLARLLVFAARCEELKSK